MKAASLFGFVAGVHWFILIVAATVTVTVRTPVGCSAGDRATFSGNAQVITTSIPGVSIASPLSVPSYLPPTEARSPIILPSATASNGCEYQYAACLQVNDNLKPLMFVQTEELTIEYCATFCANHDYFGVQQGDFCYCGPVQPGYTELEPGACNQPCAGNITELCGQSSVIQEYSKVACVSTTTASSVRPSDTVGNSTLLQGSSTPPITNTFTNSASSSPTAVDTGPESSTPSTVITGVPSSSWTTDDMSSSSALTSGQATDASSDLSSNSLSSSTPLSNFSSSLSISPFSATSAPTSTSATALTTPTSGNYTASSSSSQADAVSPSSSMSPSSSASSTSILPFNGAIPVTLNFTTTTSTTITLTMPPTSRTRSSSSSVSAPPIPPSSVPSSSAIPSPTVPSTYALRLSDPTPLVSANDSYSQYGITLPFSMSLYNSNGTDITITDNGLLTIGNSNGINEAYADNPPPPNPLPNDVLNPGTAAVWWEFLQVVTGTSPEGIYYQIDNNNEVSVEWLIEDANGLVYQFIATYTTSFQGQMSFYYFATGDCGTDATIGVQGDDVNGATQSVEYMHGGNLPPGVLLTFDTNPQDTVVGRYSKTGFNLSCFPAGTFPAGVC